MKSLTHSIFSTLKGWLTPPSFPDDEDKTRVAAILNVVLWVLMGLVLLAEPVLIFRPAPPEQRWFIYFSAALAPVILGTVLHLLRQGHIRFAAWAFVLLQWISTIAQVVTSGGMHSPALSAFIVSILLAGFLISTHAAWLLTGLSLTVILLLMRADASQLIPPAILFNTNSGKFRILSSTLLVTAAMLTLIIQSLKTAMHRSHTYAQKLEEEQARLKQTVQALTAAQENIRQLNETLEGRVRARTAELEASNQELEAFSYSVSHDLRAPLRAVNGYAGILEHDYAKNLPAEAQAYLEKIQTASTKMGKLIDELLTFSRLGRNPLHRAAVDVNALVRTLLESFAPETAGRQIEWILADLPTANCDPGLIQQVFANLIGNAIKYTGQRARARIEIGCSQQNAEQVYFVRDNGAGFDMAYANKLFGVFQRLHREDEFEGTGIGLATVQRIITRHGGRIWAEAEPDKGATFYFTLV